MYERPWWAVPEDPQMRRTCLTLYYTPDHGVQGACLRLVAGDLILQRRLQCRGPSTISLPGLRRSRGRPPGCTAQRLWSLSVVGRLTMKVVPRLEPALAAVMLPPWASTMALLMVRPMPEPVRSRVRAESPR